MDGTASGLSRSLFGVFISGSASTVPCSYATDRRHDPTVSRLDAENRPSDAYAVTNLLANPLQMPVLRFHFVPRCYSALASTTPKALGIRH